ncbi:TPA: ATP-binding cassette domain-containing protein, partial [Aeromonas hydrophila]|nr:ATP-binding cassette domain-containing protein [Aeromonas hydrophila]
MLSTTPLHLYLEENLLLSLPALKIMPGEVLTLMGPSGCGKSSLLAALAGVLPASGPLRLEGDVTLGERRLTHLPPQARRIGMLFQDDLLFDHLTVAENLMFGMSASVKGHRTRREKAVAALAQVDLTSQADKLPG